MNAKPVQTARPLTVKAAKTALSALLLLSTSGLAQAQGKPLEIWTFVDTHARFYKQIGKECGIPVNVTQTAYDALYDRLRISLQSGGVGAPDLVDMEQGVFGSFLKGGDPGLVDLTSRLKDGNYTNKVVAAREALYQYDGKTYGIELALTPVILYYRTDLWAKAGIDPTKFKTWNEFIAGAKQLHAKLPGSVGMPVYPDLFQALLRQRGTDFFDAKGNVTIDSPLAISTMQWMIDQVKSGVASNFSGPGGVPSSPADYASYKAGKWASAVGADWYGGFLRDNVPSLSGKWKATGLPAWTADGSHTSVAGGTGSSIVATSPNIDQAWKFMQCALLTTKGSVERYQLNKLYPAFIPSWSDPRLQATDPYFSNQSLGKLYASVADKLPKQYQSPYRTQLNDAYIAAYSDMITGKVAPATALKKIADDVRAQIQRDK